MGCSCSPGGHAASPMGLQPPPADYRGPWVHVAPFATAPMARPPWGDGPLLGPRSGALGRFATSPTPLAMIGIRLGNGTVALSAMPDLAQSHQINTGVFPMTSQVGPFSSSSASPMAEVCIRLSDGQIIPMVPQVGGTGPMSVPIGSVGPFSSGASPMVSLCIVLSNGQIIPLVPASATGMSTMGASASPLSSNGASPMVQICLRLSNGQLVPLAPASQTGGAASPFGTSAMGGATSPFAGTCAMSVNLGGQVLPLCL